MKKYASMCMAFHEKEFSGPFARVMNWIWWLKHDHCKSPNRKVRKYG